MLKLSEGKYTIISPEDNKGNFRALRYGEEWRDLTGDGLVLSLVQHAEELEAENERLRGNVGAEAALRRAAETTGTVVIYRDGKIVQEEVGKGKLHGLTVKLARECFDDGYGAGMERAAEIVKSRLTNNDAKPYYEVWNSALYGAETAIRAELEPVTQPEER